MWIKYNANPQGKSVGDCVIRALSKALNQSWEDTFCDIADKGIDMADMPSSNSVWGAYLRDRGYERHIIPVDCPECYCVEDFCRDHPKGKFILAISGHVVCVIDGNIYDSWDSSNEIPVYYWEEAKQHELLPSVLSTEQLSNEFYGKHAGNTDGAHAAGIRIQCGTA